MNFWIAVIGVVAASALVYIATSINGKNDVPGGDAKGHDDHGHGGPAHH